MTEKSMSLALSGFKGFRFPVWQADTAALFVFNHHNYIQRFFELNFCNFDVMHLVPKV